MSSKTKLLSVLALIAVCVVPATQASAGYITAGSIHPDDFTFFPTPTAWDPGPGTARVGGFPAPGGATWSVMGAGLSDGSGFDAHGGAMTTLLSSLYAGGVMDEITAIGMALDTWAAVSGFTNLGMVADGGGAFGAAGAAGGVGDIRVGAIYIDGAVGSNVLAHAYQPGTPVQFGAGGFIAGDVHFDNSNSWSDGGGAGTIDFFTVALHELGHALGLGHSTVAGSVMEAVYAGPRRTLSADDIAGIQAIYGPNLTTSAPEPTSMALLGLASLGGLGLRLRNRRKARNTQSVA